MDPASKVKIEYTDPSGIFSTFASELVQRLPLKELHWSSSSRPTRSIGSLHIDLVSSDRPKSDPAHSSTDGSASSQDTGVSSKYEGARKERRHQIPGLRRTPYLKVYLLSCNDVESYKGSFRKQLREWVKDNSPPSQSSAALNKQDNHDAFEWLIIHVLSSSVDSSIKTPRPSSTQGETIAERRSSSSRWPSRNSTSVIEKLLSEFNSTSKSAVDRVVQVQLVEPPLNAPPQVDRRVQDSKNGWDDLIFKLKTLILASFDLRVSQYEDDIKERERKKKVFGWNFNTFFVLKEGLAMGFENMGLLEDALAVYQELGFGLQSVIEEQQIEGAEQQTAHFANYTEDLYEDFKQAGVLTGTPSADDSATQARLIDLGASLLKTDRKPFRELILSNKISVFDFQCYVFARQFTLSLRLANVTNERAWLDKVTDSQDTSSGKDGYNSDATDLSKPSDYEPENLLLLADLAKSSTEFITSTTRTVRVDINCAISHFKTKQPDNGTFELAGHDGVVENFVMSWLFSASQGILEEISARSLISQLNPLLHQLAPKATSSEAVDDKDQPADKVDDTGRQNLPVRTSSLLSGNPIRSLPPPHQQFPSVNFLDAAKLLPPGNPRPGTQDLAAERGDLIALRRRVLNNLSVRHGIWQGISTGSILSVQQEELQDVELSEGPPHPDDDTASTFIPAKASSTTGLCNTDLILAVSSRDDFYRTYENLTVSALAHYVIGGRSKAAEAMTADVALARYQLKDYAGAASYFRQLAPFYANTDWSALEISMLDNYALCLKQLEQRDDYVRISLKILAGIIRDNVMVRRATQNQYEKLQDSRHILGGARDYLNAILTNSKLCNVEFSASLDDYFGDIQLDKYVRHFPDQDGFELHLRFRSFLPEEFMVKSVQVRLLTSEIENRSELWLSTDRTQSIRPGLVLVPLKSKVLQPGRFVLDKINIKSSNIMFTLDLSPATQQVHLFPRNRDSTSLVHLSDFVSRKSIMLWPRAESLDVLVTQYEVIDLERPNSIKVLIGTGQNVITRCRLSLRAASAGLRLHTAEAQALEGNVEITDKSQAGSLSIANLSADTKTNIVIPYSIETDLREINLRVTVEYTTPNGEFTFVCNASISISLPLAINVQDLFKQAMLVSKFTIGTSSAVPVRVYECHLEGNAGFRVATPQWKCDELDVFLQQPLSLVAKIFRKNNGSRSSQNMIFLKVKYRCLGEIIYGTVERRFKVALDASPYKKFSRVLWPVLLATLRSRIVAQDLEPVCLLREVNVGAFDESDWDSLIAGLSSEAGEGLGKWLRRWHEENLKISMGDEDMLLVMQDLTVPVEIPQMHVVHTARLRRLEMSSSHPQLDSVPGGKGIPMELTISHTRKWGSEETHGAEDQALDFFFEIQANPDVWVVGGQRKVHFSSMENEESRFAVLLWPQKTGHLVLPSLEVHSLNPSSEQTGDEDFSAEPAISCELDYQNAGEAIMVVPDLISTTVSLDPGGNGGGWLVETKSRPP